MSARTFILFVGTFLPFIARSPASECILFPSTLYLLVGQNKMKGMVHVEQRNGGLPPSSNKMTRVRNDGCSKLYSHLILKMRTLSLSILNIPDKTGKSSCTAGVCNLGRRTRCLCLLHPLPRGRNNNFMMCMKK